MNAEQLRRAEIAFKAAYERAEGARETRNRLVREARAAGWTLQQIADVTGLSRGRLSQIVGTDSAAA